MEKRWIAFFLFTFAVILLFQSRVDQHQKRIISENQKQRLEAAARELKSASSETSQTLAALKQSVESAVAPTADLRAPTADLRAPTPTEDAETVSAEPRDIAQAPRIVFQNTQTRVEFSTLGGLPVQWTLRGQAPDARDRTQPNDSLTTVNLIPDVSATQREWPLSLDNKTLKSFNELPHEVLQRTLPDQSRQITFVSPIQNGIQVLRTYTFPPTGYLSQFAVTVRNTTTDRRKRFDDNGLGLGIGWQGGFLQPEESTRVTGTVNALVSNNSGLKSLHLKPSSEPELIQGPIAWAGVEKKFFLAAIVPATQNTVGSALALVRERNMTDIYRRKGYDAPISVVLQHEPFDLEPGAERLFQFQLFAGPKFEHVLKLADASLAMPPGPPSLRDTLYHETFGGSVVRWLVILLLHVLNWFEKTIGGYGLAIILLTLCVRLVTYPLTHKAMKIQAKTMAQQAKLKPYIDEINAKYKDNPAARNQALMKLWKEHNINPFGMLRGCLPILLQMPVFIALYVLLDQAIELRGQSFLWIKDLSTPDRLITFPMIHILFFKFDSINILPLLMAGTQMISTRMTLSAAMDPAQQKMMMLMPVFFLVFLYTFPSGLMLYWVVTNVWQIGQQAFTNNLIKKEQQAATAA